MDCGCTVHGYQSDISRTWVHGEANAEQRLVWTRMRKGQDIAFAAARLGAPAGSVDDAVRAPAIPDAFEVSSDTGWLESDAGRLTVGSAPENPLRYRFIRYSRIHR